MSPALTWLLVFLLPLQFVGFLTTVVLLQIAAGVAGYLFTDTVPSQQEVTHHFLQPADQLCVGCPQVMERTEKLMMTAVVRYREDRDLENAIDFIQKKVKVESSVIG